LAQDIDEKQRIKWLQKSAKLLEKLHSAGVCQQDIHLDNLLVSNGCIYIIDGGGASVSGACKRSKMGVTFFDSKFGTVTQRFLNKTFTPFAQFIHLFKKSCFRPTCSKRIF
jgi:tRNA A-37 threonylcarbamoyl transferase component Bud32